MVAGSIATNTRNSAAGFTVSGNGVLAYLKARTQTGSQLQTVPIVVTMNWPALNPGL
jgi:hypothetical protein